MTGWPVWLPSIPTPEQVTVGWSIGDRIDEAAVDVAGRVHGDHDVDVECVRCGAGVGRMGGHGAGTGREQRAPDRPAAGIASSSIVRPSEHVVLARVVGAPIRLGAFAEPLVAAGRRDLPWPGLA